jgi:hypothetical protein
MSRGEPKLSHGRWTAVIGAIGIVCAAAVLALAGAAAAEEDSQAGAPAGPDTARADSAYTDLAAFPIVFYTPETGLGFGAAGAYFIRPQGATRPSSISGIAFYSTRGNLQIGIAPELYSRDASRRITGGLSYQDFPQYFYGIGNDTEKEMQEEYTSRAAILNFVYQRRFYRGMRTGLRYHFRYERVTEVEEDGMLSTGEVPGTEEHKVSGLGILTTWDNRDNIVFTRKGTFVELLGIYYGDIFGSDYEYSRISFDVRLFTPVIGEHSVALRGLTTVVSGEAPFQDLATLGGAFLMRGYDDGRFRDKSRLVFQGEYRSAYWWRLAVTVFGSYGGVAHRASDLDFGSFRYAAGLGLRVRLNDENFNLRVDVGVGEDSDGFYIVAGEAF